MSRNDLALGPKIQVDPGQVVPYFGGGKGRVLVVNGRSPSGLESSYPIYTQDEDTGAVYSHRVDGALGLPGGSPYDIRMPSPEIKVHVRAYRDNNGTIRIVAAQNEWPSTPLPPIGETTCVIEAVK